MRVWLCPRLDGRVTADTFYEIGVIKLSCHAALNQGDGFGKKDINQAAQAIEQGHRRVLLGAKKGGKDINQAAQAIDQGKTFGGINQAQAGE